MELEKVSRISLATALNINRVLLIADLLVVLMLLLAWWLGTPIESIRLSLISFSLDAVITYLVGCVISDYYYDGITNIFDMNISYYPTWFNVFMDILYILLVANRLFEIANIITGRLL